MTTVMDQPRCKPRASAAPHISARCPVTGETVTTALACDGDDFARIPFLVAIENSPACGAAHSWKKSETFLIKPSNSSPRRGSTVTDGTLRA